MSYSPPEYQGLKRVLSRNLVRIKDTDGSIAWFKRLAIMVVYTNRNPDADGLQIWLTVDNQNTDVRQIPAEYLQTVRRVVSFDLDNLIPDTAFPPFILTAKPPWTSVPVYPNTEQLNVTPEQYEGYFTLFRNITITGDILHVVVDNDEFTLPMVATDERGHFIIPVFNPTTSLINQVYTWWCETGNIDKMIIHTTGINNAVAKTIRVNYDEYKGTTDLVGTYGYFDEIIQLISLQFV